MTKIKKAHDSYRSLGSYTRLVIRITIILFISVMSALIYAETATYSENHYNLLLLSDNLFQCLKSISGMGFLGIIIVGIIEGSST